jgi:hypothetical protein
MGETPDCRIFNGPTDSCHPSLYHDATRCERIPLSRYRLFEPTSSSANDVLLNRYRMLVYSGCGPFLLL